MLKQLFRKLPKLNSPEVVHSIILLLLYIVLYYLTNIVAIKYIISLFI